MARRRRWRLKLWDLLVLVLVGGALYWVVLSGASTDLGNMLGLLGQGLTAPGP